MQQALLGQEQLPYRMQVAGGFEQPPHAEHDPLCIKTLLQQPPHAEHDPLCIKTLLQQPPHAEHDPLCIKTLLQQPPHAEHDPLCIKTLLQQPPHAEHDPLCIKTLLQQPPHAEHDPLCIKTLLQQPEDRMGAASLSHSNAVRQSATEAKVLVKHHKRPVADNSNLTCFCFELQDLNMGEWQARI